MPHRLNAAEREEYERAKIKLEQWLEESALMMKAVMSKSVVLPSLRSASKTNQPLLPMLQALKVSKKSKSVLSCQISHDRSVKGTSMVTSS